ncbi:MAG: diguanylate cyclase [Pseudomonadales bacterium]|nr:diguanylate cyclase [Pseudomonadales bacterium]
MSTSNVSTEGLQKLQSEYRLQLPVKLESINRDWLVICAEGWQDIIARRIHGTCHQLAASGEVFGFSLSSRYARNIESQLNHIFDVSYNPDSSIIDVLGVAIEQLVAHAMTEDAPEDSKDRRHGAAVLPDDLQTLKRSGDLHSEPLSKLPIFVVEEDVVLADQIVLEFVLLGYDARAVYSLAEFDTQLRGSKVAPAAIVMDIMFPGAANGGMDLINKLRQDQVLAAPVVFISAGDSFATRLAVVRAGGKAFFVKPIDQNSLIEKIESLVRETDPNPLRVLVVDDDLIAASVVCVVLEEAGFVAQALDKPAQIIEHVLDFHPDLVILDMHMPEVNGMEVAQVLRQHETGGEMPLLFLSAEADPVKRAAALNVGVDDFLVKPVNHDYLISAVENRAFRARQMAVKITRDSLTHLLVHGEITNQLIDMLFSAQRYSRDLCYVILDLDNFKNINDTYGHLTGDKVIKSLAGMLRRSFRRSDIVGRYGGEEFVVIMQDTKIDAAMVVMNRVREEFSRFVHFSDDDGSEFITTFSAGLSSFPQFSTVEKIQAQADRALYSAKNEGRNKVSMA